jgi:CheY-like chemotaxis protein
MAARFPPVLIVEDNDGIRQTLRALLEEEDFSTVEEAGDGRHALQRLRAAPERLVVLLDLLMPQLTGKDVLEALAADPALAGRHAVVVVTAARTTLPRSVAIAAALLNASVLAKPFDIADLLALVAQAARRLR